MKRVIVSTLVAAALAVGVAPAATADVSARQTPKACLRALDYAEDARQVMIRLVDEGITTYATAVTAAAERALAAGTLAAQADYIADQSAAYQELIAKVEELTGPVTAAYAGFDRTSKKCRTGR